MFCLEVFCFCREVFGMVCCTFIALVLSNKNFFLFNKN